ncbi:hypothetical protein N9L26_01430 [Candidatus Pacebacteria bacterium]|nr:hypothetical protein [Candidatus Paceibacterota bacterium]
MKENAKLLSNHSIGSWEIGGVPLLFPEYRTSSLWRGGAPMCSPMFSTQQRPIDGCTLPLHGMVMYNEDGVVRKDGLQQGVQTIHKADQNFSWDFTAVTEIETDKNTLIHQHTLTRSSDCSNPSQMPFSLGFHPYFATSGKDFALTIADTHFTRTSLPTDIVNSYFAQYISGESATLTTADGTIVLTPEGYDEYCIWTDCAERYICIEPIFQYRDFGLPGTGLKPGESHTARTALQFTPSD